MDFNYTAIPLADKLGSLPPEAAVLILSLIPGVEPRYAVLAGVLLGLSFSASLLISMLSLLALSLMLTVSVGYIDAFMSRMTSSRGILSRIALLYVRLRDRSASKASGKVERWGVLGLIAFIAVPLPATGVYTGALASIILGIRGYKLLMALIVGGILSIMIMSITANIIL